MTGSEQCSFLPSQQGRQREINEPPKTTPRFAAEVWCRVGGGGGAEVEWRELMVWRWSGGS